MNFKLPTKNPCPIKPGIYNIDLYQRRPFFQVKDKQKSFIVKSWEEAYALHGAPKISDINPAFIATLINKNYSAKLSPYLRIRRLPRSSNFYLDNNGDIEIIKYNPFLNHKNEEAALKAKEKIRELLSKQLQNFLKNRNKKIFCEHTSGIDSNSILGTLINDLKINPEKINTFSFFDPSEIELIRNYRKFYNLKDENCYEMKSKTNNKNNENNKNLFSNNELKILSIFGAPTMTGLSIDSCELLAQNNCDLLLSGFGGDQCLSHNSSNIPTDLIVLKRWGDLLFWSDNLYESSKLLIKRTLIRKFPSIGRLNIRLEKGKLSRSNLLINSLTQKGKELLSPFIREYLHPELDLSLTSNESIIKQVSGEFVCMRIEEETRLAKAYGISKEFPLLREKIIEEVLKLDPLVFGKKGKDDRKLAKDIFYPVLPNGLRTNALKDRSILSKDRLDIEKVIIKNITEQNNNIDLINHNLKELWDVEYIKQKIGSIMDSKKTKLNLLAGINSSLLILNKLNLWFNEIEK